MMISVVYALLNATHEDGVNIHESFVGFLSVHDTTGEGLFSTAFFEKPEKCRN
jgi:hypothetical protein